MDLVDALDSSIPDIDEPSVVPVSDSPEPDVALAEFFPPEFMNEHTRFGSFAEFCGESPWEIDDREDLASIPPDGLDRYVDRTTQFETWDGMRNRAAVREIADWLLV